MSLIKTQGVVIKHINLGENDKIITLLTDKLGKVEVVVHGAKSPKSKFMASTQPFCYGEYLLYRGKSLYTLSESNIIDSFQGILMDLDKLAYGSYILELMDNLTEKESKNIPMLALLLKTLYILIHDDVNLPLLKLTLEFKAISLSGYLPQVKYCTKCKNPLTEGYFNISDGGILCTTCGKNTKSDYTVSSEDVKFFNVLKNIKLEDLKKLNVNQRMLEYIQTIMQNYIMYHCEKKFKSLEILKKLK